MRFKDVSAFFDKMECRDAYSNVLAFYGQIGLFDDSKRDSETAQRRIISTSATAMIPARRAVRAGGTTFIIGQGHADDFQNSTSRVGFVVHEATQLAVVQGLDEACTGAVGFGAYAARAWVKDSAFSQQSSTLDPRYHLHFSITEPVEENDVVSFDNNYYLVRSVTKGAGGFLVTSCDEMQGAVRVSATVTTGAWSATTESSSGTPTVMPVLRLRWQSLFSYGGEQSPKFEAGDIQIIVAKTNATMVAGATAAMFDGIWRVRSVVSVGGVWVCRASLDD